MTFADHCVSVSVCVRACVCDKSCEFAVVALKLPFEYSIALLSGASFNTAMLLAAQMIGKTIGCLRAKRRKQIRWHRLITSLRSLKRTAAECLLYSFQCGQQWTILNANSYAFGPRVVLIESFHHINNDRTINLRR